MKFSFDANDHEFLQGLVWFAKRIFGGGIRHGFNEFRSELRDATKTTTYSRSGMAAWDNSLLWAVIMLVLLGIVMVYSASITLADGKKYANYSSTYFNTAYFFYRGCGNYLDFLPIKFPLRYGIKSLRFYLWSR
jgi:cell division protein FtsW